jgi:AmiR/NasT family two-component response regulator
MPDENSTSTDGQPPDAVAEVARLTVYADEQARRVDTLETSVLELRSALRSRVVIERAVGMLAERFDLTLADAFELLRSAARNSRRQLHALAEELTESRGWTPDEIADARRGIEPT